ncbi:MAG TPA: hypothetical protein VGN88_02920, partial [Phycisphaerae bacterium]
MTNAVKHIVSPINIAREPVMMAMIDIALRPEPAVPAIPIPIAAMLSVAPMIMSGRMRGEKLMVIKEMMGASASAEMPRMRARRAGLLG